MNYFVFFPENPSGGASRVPEVKLLNQEFTQMWSELVAHRSKQMYVEEICSRSVLLRCFLEDACLAIYLSDAAPQS